MTHDPNLYEDDFCDEHDMREDIKRDLNERCPCCDKKHDITWDCVNKRTIDTKPSTC